MKSVAEVEKNRVQYHSKPHSRSVHRSSLLVPRFDWCKTVISFLNHFLIKRDYQEVGLKVTALDSSGREVGSQLFNINDRRSYSFDLDGLFAESEDAAEYLVEFFSDKNLFIPFPAVMINHYGNDFVNSVHSYNRVLNDIFEDDAINRIQVNEASVDVCVDDDRDTFFNFATGPLASDDPLQVILEKGDIRKVVKIDTDQKRLTHKNYRLTDIIDEAEARGFDGGVMKVLQPRQTLFYGRLLAGVQDRKTGAFSANHSYYDSSSVEEYFQNNRSSRVYSYFPGASNRITMYPIMSPSDLSVFIRVKDGDGFRETRPLELRSPSGNPVTIDVDAELSNLGLSNATAFEVVATSETGQIPTRVNHQLIYGSPNSEIRSSINLSLLNEAIFMPPSKTGQAWGQILVDPDYDASVGFCFGNSGGTVDQVDIDFYNEEGLFHSLSEKIGPLEAFTLPVDEIPSSPEGGNFIWYYARSKRPDLSAQCFHSHKKSSIASGEHSF